MPTLGQILKAAREQKGLTPSELAAITRIKTQYIQDLEREDFSRIAAPAYARGFIKLYAEQVGLEAAPLIEEYNRRHARVERVSLIPDASGTASQDPAGAPERAPILPGWKILSRKISWPRVGLIGGVAVLAIFLLSGLSRLFVGSTDSRLGEASGGAWAGPRPLPVQERPASLSIIREPPDPYLAGGISLEPGEL